MYYKKSNTTTRFICMMYVIIVTRNLGLIEFLEQ